MNYDEAEVQRSWEAFLAEDPEGARREGEQVFKIQMRRLRESYRIACQMESQNEPPRYPQEAAARLSAATPESEKMAVPSDQNGGVDSYVHSRDDSAQMIINPAPNKTVGNLTGCLSCGAHLLAVYCGWCGELEPLTDEDLQDAQRITSLVENPECRQWPGWSGIPAPRLVYSCDCAEGLSDIGDAEVTAPSKGATAETDHVAPAAKTVSIETMLEIFVRFPRQTGLLAILAGHIEQSELFRTAGNSSTQDLLCARLGFKRDRATKLLRAGRTASKYFNAEARAIIDILTTGGMPDTPTLKRLPTVTHLLALARLSERMDEPELLKVVDQVRRSKLSATKINLMTRELTPKPKPKKTTRTKKTEKAAPSIKAMERQLDQALTTLAALEVQVPSTTVAERTRLRAKVVALADAGFALTFSMG